MIKMRMTLRNQKTPSLLEETFNKIMLPKLETTQEETIPKVPEEREDEVKGEVVKGEAVEREEVEKVVKVASVVERRVQRCACKRDTVTMTMMISQSGASLSEF